MQTTLWSLALILVIACATGWVKNLIKLSDCDFKEPYKAEIIRTVGVFVPPIGVVTGYINLGK